MQQWLLIVLLSALSVRAQWLGVAPWGPSSPPAASLPSPAIWWKFADGSGTTPTDSSGNGYGGVFEGALGNPTWVGFGSGIGTPSSAAPYCLQYIGADSEYVESSSAFITQMSQVQNATLCGWVYVAASNLNWSFGFALNTANRFVLTGFSGTAYSCVCNGTNNYPNFSWTWTGWHFVATTFDGTKTGASRVVVYVDAVAQTLTPGGAGNPSQLPPASSLENFYSGNDVADGPNYMTGGACDIRCYNVTLTPTQITHVYNNIDQP